MTLLPTRTILSPAALGMPPSFKAWRPHQPAAIMRALEATQRFIGCQAPTGFGKSAMVYGLHLLMCQSKPHHRTLVVTSTKALQHQYADTFPIAVLKGMNTYDCRLDSWAGIKADRGPCLAGMTCSFMMGGCAYYDAVRAAKAAPIVVINYALWMRLDPDSLGSFDLLVLDEAHDAPGWIADYKAVRLWRHEVEGLGYDMPPLDHDIEGWADWATLVLNDVAARVEHLHSSVVRDMSQQIVARVPVGTMDEAYELKVLQRKLETMTEMDANWVLDWDDKQASVKFDPVWPGRWASSLLFKGIPKVVMTSATLCRKTAFMLGVSNEALAFHVWPSDFDPHRRPIYVVPTVAMGAKTTKDEFITMVRRVDQIISQRRDRKGIIQSVSFDRAKQLARTSQFDYLMITNTSGSTHDRVKEFRQARSGKVLVSPSVTTGWDFQGDECRYIIVVKIPFGDTRPVIAKAREAADRDYGIYAAAQAIEQMVGRGMRNEDDWCEVFILDSNWSWFYRRASPYFSDWFKACIRPTPMLPAPLRGY